MWSKSSVCMTPCHICVRVTMLHVTMFHVTKLHDDGVCMTTVWWWCVYDNSVMMVCVWQQCDDGVCMTTVWWWCVYDNSVMMVCVWQQCDDGELHRWCRLINEKADEHKKLLAMAQTSRNTQSTPSPMPDEVTEVRSRIMRKSQWVTSSGCPAVCSLSSYV